MNNDQDSSCRTLWLEVFHRVMLDAFPEIPESKRGLTYIRHNITLDELRDLNKAHSWFNISVYGFQDVCDLIGIEPEAAMLNYKNYFRFYYRRVQLRLLPLDDKMIELYAKCDKLGNLIASIDREIIELWQRHKIKIIKMQKSA